MGVEMNDCDRPIRLVDAAEQRQRDGVVTTQGDDAGEGLSVDRDTRLIGISVRLPHQELIVPLLDLANRPGVIVSVIPM